MASPTLDSICCLLRNDTVAAVQLLAPYFLSRSYTLTCLVFALCGIVGAVYQILHSHVILLRTSQSQFVFVQRGRRILKWLGVADLLAALGMVARCISWLADSTILSDLQISQFTSDFCITTSTLTQFFYTATYMWTLLYAVDVLLTLLGRPGTMCCYGMVGWLVPLLLSLLSVLTLFTPNSNCHISGADSFARHLPGYLSVYSPLTVVMLSCPVLVRLSLSRLRVRVVSSCSRFGNRERRLLFLLRFKFISVVAVFYLCWLPNLVNGLILWSTWPDIPVKLVVVVWYMMAVLNPLQAVFNSLLYRSWDPSAPSVLHWLREQFPCGSGPFRSPLTRAVTTAVVSETSEMTPLWYNPRTVAESGPQYQSC